MSVKILVGDCVESMKSMSDQSVHSCVTSPPYWGLRDYGHAGQIGLEDTPEAYVARMVEVFREVRRVLRDDGTLWLNLGDSYANAGGGQMAWSTATEQAKKRVSCADMPRRDVSMLKPKDLVGIPWRVAFALQADGWWLRQDIIWHKPNPMPESVTDRCTKSHEYVFLLTKRERYFYDAEAVKEPQSDASLDRYRYAFSKATNDGNGWVTTKQNVERTTIDPSPSGRNRRSVWTITTKPYSGAHFAVMPPDLVEPCIKAGTSEEGCCPACGKPWERVVERGESSWEARKAAGHKISGYHAADGAIASFATPEPREGKRNEGGLGWVAPSRTLGWRPACTCGGSPVPCTVLDPFGGAGTTALVADQLHRNAILCELNPDYAGLAENRIRQDSPMFSDVVRT